MLTGLCMCVCVCVLDNQVVLELQGNGNLTTSDDPPVVFGCFDTGFIEKVFVLFEINVQM